MYGTCWTIFHNFGFTSYISWITLGCITSMCTQVNVTNWFCVFNILEKILKCIREVEDLHQSSEGQVGRIKEISFKTMKVTTQNKSLPQLDKGPNCKCSLFITYMCTWDYFKWKAICARGKFVLPNYRLFSAQNTWYNFKFIF
jgi:hypothetical protein